MTLVIYAAVSLKDEQLGVCEFGSRMELSLKEGGRPAGNSGERYTRGVLGADG